MQTLNIWLGRISPYAFSYAPDGDDESQHLFIYSFDYNGYARNHSVYRPILV